MNCFASLVCLLDDLLKKKLLTFVSVHTGKFTRFHRSLSSAAFPCGVFQRLEPPLRNVILMIFVF